MIRIRKSQERGYADHGWLKSYHSFSFAGYYDPAHMGFGNLRVINEDRVAPGMGFGTHSHQDMEIVSIVLKGNLAHKDSMGNVETIPAGDVQRMSAGSGVTHSEFNHSHDEETHFLQIWILPDRDKLGIAPSYEQRSIPVAAKRGQWCLIAAPHGHTKGTQALGMSADAKMYLALLDGQDQLSVALEPQRLAYVHLIEGEATVNGQRLQAGDAVALTDEAQLSVSDSKAAHLLRFDLAA